MYDDAQRDVSDPPTAAAADAGTLLRALRTAADAHGGLVANGALYALLGIAAEPVLLARELTRLQIVSADPMAGIAAQERARATEWLEKALPRELAARNESAPWWLQSERLGDETVFSARAPDGRVVLGFAADATDASRGAFLGALLAAHGDGRLVAVAVDSAWTAARDALARDRADAIVVLAPPRADVTTKPSLFRAEVASGSPTRLEGEVLVVQPLSQRMLGAGAALAAVLLLVVAFNGRFAKTETASGVLMPTSGVARVSAPQAGIVNAVAVKSGDRVVAGQQLMTIADARVSDGRTIDRTIRAELEQSLALSVRERETTERQAEMDARELRAVLAAAEANAVQVARQRDLQAQREALLREKVDRASTLLASGVIARSQVQELQEQVIAAELATVGLTREVHNARSSVRQARVALDDQPLKLRSRLGELDQRASEYKQRLAEAGLRGEVEVTAPRAGRVAAVLASVGDRVGGDRPLVLIVDDGEPLQAQLFVPTRGAGFIHEGQEVRLRLQAFPYQRFGYQAGQIVQVSRATLSPDEIDAPVQVREPVYAVRVSLDAQSVLAFGRENALQAGMLLDADIVTDRPRIIEWVLEPLFSLRGRH